MPTNSLSSTVAIADQSIDEQSHTWQRLDIMEPIHNDELASGLASKERHVLRQLHAPGLQHLMDDAPNATDRDEQDVIQRILDDVRLRFFFGGRAVAYVLSDRGPIIVSSSDSADNLDFSIPELKAQGHQSVTISFPEPLDLSANDDLPFFYDNSAPPEKASTPTT